MLIWFIPVVTVVIFFVFVQYNRGVDCESAFIGLLIGFCGLLLSFLICVGVCACSDTQIVEAEPEVKTVYAMNDVYLRRNESKYVYMVFEEGKGLTTEEAGTKDSYINYTTETPYVEIYSVEVRNPVIRFLFQFGNIFSRDHYFYLPETANVTNDFIIDLE